MKNTFNKVTQSLFEAFKGPRTKDYEYEKMVQEYQSCKERMLSLKRIIDNYPSRLEGYKMTLDELTTTFEYIFDKYQPSYYQFMSNVVGAHKALNEKLNNMLSRLEQLKTSLGKWTENCTSVDSKIALREEKRKNFDHYDEKMAEMLEDRNKIITKGKIPGEKDDERYTRNVKKYQSSAKDYVDATNDAYKHIGYFLDSRYENISLSVAELITIEAAFYNDASYIFNFFRNCRNNVNELRNTLRPITRDYEAANFIRGKSLLNVDIEEMMKGCTSITGIIEGKPGYNKNSNNNTNNDMKKANTMNQNYNNTNYNNNNYGNNRSRTFLDPYSNNNNNNFGTNNYANNFNSTNPYNKPNIDNSIPDPFANQGNNDGSGFNPYGNQPINNDNNNNDTNLNPYDQGNNNPGDNPFDNPNP